jgi:hypothetical protein
MSVATILNRARQQRSCVVNSRYDFERFLGWFLLFVYHMPRSRGLSSSTEGVSRADVGIFADITSEFYP